MKKILTIVSLSFLCCFCFAQRVLTVEDAVQLALQNNVSIKQSELDLKLLKTKNTFSWNSISPSFSLSGGLNGNASGTFEDPTINKSLGWSASGSVRLSLTPSLATSIRSAKLAYESGELNYDSTIRSIELSVRKTFYSLLYFNENLNLQERGLETARQTYQSNLSKYEQGRLSELNLLSSQYNYENKIPTIANLNATYESNLDNFKLILGIPLEEKIELTGSLDDAVDVQIAENDILVDLESVPAVKLAIKSLESAKNNLTATRFSTYSPSISFSGGASTNSTIDPEPVKDPGLSLSYGASVSIPLDGFLPWSNNALNVTSMKNNVEKQKQNLEQTKLKTEIALKNGYNSIIQAQKQLQLYEKNVELMQKTYDMSLVSYNAGSADFLSLQTAENNLYQARYNVQNQKYTIISAVLDLENTLGVKFNSLDKEK